MIQSTAYVLVQGFDYRYHFCGVTAIRHSFTSQIATQEDSSLGADYLNGARNEPDTVTLTVAESDAMRSAGWAARMAEVFESVKRHRRLCTVVTAFRTYDNMILTEFTFEENEDSQSGWTGTLTFTETKNFGAGKAEDNSSTPVNTAAAAPAAVVSAASSAASAAMKSLPESLRRLLEKAGIR